MPPESWFQRRSSPQKGATQEKLRALQKHGGAHTTHNTSECRKYEKDGTLQKSFSVKAAVEQKRRGSGKKESHNSFAQVMERFSKLKKAVKKRHKGARKKKLRYESSDSSDSNSE